MEEDYRELEGKYKEIAGALKSGQDDLPGLKKEQDKAEEMLREVLMDPDLKAGRMRKRYYFWREKRSVPLSQCSAIPGQRCPITHTIYTMTPIVPWVLRVLPPVDYTACCGNSF